MPSTDKKLKHSPQPKKKTKTKEDTKYGPILRESWKRGLTETGWVKAPQQQKANSQHPVPKNRGEGTPHHISCDHNAQDDKRIGMETSTVLKRTAVQTPGEAGYHLGKHHRQERAGVQNAQNKKRVHGSGTETTLKRDESNNDSDSPLTDSTLTDSTDDEGDNVDC